MENVLKIRGYKIKRLIAHGGMASVYEAVQKSLKRPVALKILKNIDNPELSERFINEGRVIASLNHPNIITIHDIGVVGGKLFISMELLKGEDLSKKISRGINPQDALRLIRKISACLQLVHEKGIVHRDIKPANILFRDDKTLVLTDFGIAKQLHSDSQATIDGTAMGTPNYLSPEQAASKPVDQRSDIYSLGVIFYEMLTRKRPFEGGSSIEIMMSHIKEAFPPLPPSLAGYQGLLDKMVAKNPNNRFPSVTELISFIDSLSGEKAAVDIPHRNPVSDLPKAENAQSDDEETVIIQPVKSSRPARKMVLAIVSISIISGLAWTLLQMDKEAFHRLTDSAMHWVSPETPRLVPEKVVLKVPEEVPEQLPEKIIRPVVEKVVQQVLEKKPEPEPNPLIEKYLLKAELAMVSDRLTLPKNNNAYFYYLRVLEIERKNTEARQGINQIADRYADLAEWAIEDYDYEKAKGFVERGLTVNPRHRRLQKLKKRTNALKDVSKRLYKKIETFLD